MLPLASRRQFLATVGGLAASTFVCHSGSRAFSLPATSSRFKLSVITDEISEDLGHALEIANKEFGLSYVELRSLWKKNIINLDENETAKYGGFCKNLVSK